MEGTLSFLYFRCANVDGFVQGDEWLGIDDVRERREHKRKEEGHQGRRERGEKKKI